MKVEFYFDVCCPWCWIASRWLSEVQKNRDISITWRSFCLAIKNGEEKGGNRSGEGELHRKAYKIMRVIEAVRAEYGDEIIGKLYTALGKRWHLKHEQTERVILPALQELNLPASLAEAKDDAKWDKVLQKSLDSAVKVVGEDVGVPTIIFKTHRTKAGFFGPVFTKLPDKNEGLKIWDAIATLGAYPHFYELKRTRHEHADVRTTERTVRPVKSKSR